MARRRTNRRETRPEGPTKPLQGSTGRGGLGVYGLGFRGASLRKNRGFGVELQ